MIDPVSRAAATDPDSLSPARAPVVVTGLSGAGKASVLRFLEDLGYETVDNPPLAVLGALLTGRGSAALAVGVDARTRGFDAAALLAGLAALRAHGDAGLQLVFATADAEVLLRRFSETRRRHPLAAGEAADGGPAGGVTEGIAREETLLHPLREAADWVVDTSHLPLPELRRMVEARFRRYLAPGRASDLAVAIRSFAFPAGLPRDADMVFDLRFLRNPHYDPILRPMTGQDAPVAAYVEADPDFRSFWDRMTALLDPLLPRYAAEGKKYLTIALGCTGGRHRSVFAAERLATHLAGGGWRVELAHRELRALAGTSVPAHPQEPEARTFSS